MKRSLLVFILVCSSAVLAQQQHGIVLSWTLSSTPGVTSQLVCRSTTSGTENCASPLTTINDDSTTTFLDSTGTAGTTYYYVMQACILQGGVNICSSNSNEVSSAFPTVPNPQTGLGAVPR